MRFLLCSTIIPEELEKEIPGASPAAGRFLRGIKNGLEQNGHSVEEFSYIAIKGAKEAFTEHNISTDGKIFKDRTIIRSVAKYQKEILKKIDPGDIVLFYNVIYFDLGLARKIKKKGAIPALILADYTESYEERQNIIRRLIAKRVKREFRAFDYAILLSNEAVRFFNPNARTIVMEGGLDLNRFENITEPKLQDTIRFMYAGTLAPVTGVDILLEAISQVSEENVEFVFSGMGELEKQVIEAAARDNRIKYLGFIDDREYNAVLQSVSVFINPRNMHMPQNQNNFPSKVLEYLACGRVVISTRFKGWEQFQTNFEFCDDDSVALANKIKEVIDFSSEKYSEVFEENRTKAQSFGWDEQCKRIAELVQK